MSDNAPVSSAPSPAVPAAAFPVVGVGASAGGLEALTQLLKALPVDTGMGFIIVQHLAPGHASSLAEILTRATKMPVCEVRDEPAVEANHVYVIPPARDMIIAGGKLRLLPQERHARHRGIDQFFRSLAEDSRHLAIGVVLSGGASDGTLGLEVIKAEGGVTFAQDESAQHDSMPKSAVASGCVDFVLPPAGIAREIARIARHPYVAQPAAEAGAEGADGASGHGRIAEIMRRATGVDFTHYKANTMQRRIQRRMLVHKIETLAEYEEHLRATPGEIEALYQDVLINVTSFFRNPEAFAVLAEKVFPRLLAGRTRHEPVRLWTLGCSTGEEAYSLAMLFAECAEAAKSTARLQLFASDLNAAGIEKARAGRYPRSIAQDVSPDRLRKFFAEEDGHYRVTKGIREQIVFTRHNVLADPPFSRVDFISCRNLLIYLEPVLQQRVMPLLHYSLKPGGHLWLGSSESLGTARGLFDVGDARQKIFIRKPGPPPPGTGFRPSSGTLTFPAPAPGPRETAATMLHRDAERALLAKYAPPGVVVTAGLDIVQFRGETGAYLAPASGLASHELLKMLREGLLVPVRAALTRAGQEGRAVRETGVRVKGSGGFRELAIEVIPLKAAPGREAGFIVLFDEGARPPPSHESHESHGTHATNDSEIARLTQELAATREYLQSVIEQQDAANEELQSANEEAQSANEEMQSVNEELETSKEEIQSSNEELATVNDELNARNHELSRLNNDLTNVLASTQLSILIVTRDLRIRRFTRVAEKTLNLTGGDVGRPLGDIRLSLSIPDLQPLLREVIDSASPREREVQDTLGTWFSLRARPYLTHDGKIDGAVVTLVDVNTLRRERDYAQDILNGVRLPLLILDAALRVKMASRAFYEHFGMAAAQTEGRFIYDLGSREWDIPALRTLFEEILPREHAIVDYEVRYIFKQLGLRSMLLNACRLAQAPAEEPLIILSIEDITERRRAEQALVEQSRLLDLTNDAILVRDLGGRITYWNAGAEKLYGWTRREALGKISHTLLQTETRVAYEQIKEALFRDGHWTGEFAQTRSDGGRITVLARKSLDRDSRGNPVAILQTNTDITERKQGEEAQARLAAIVESSDDAIVSQNLDGIITSWNAAAERLFGYPAAEIVGRPATVLIPPERLAEEAHIRQGEPVEHFETVRRRKDGTLFDVSLTSSPLVDGQGRIVGASKIARDITERKQAQEALAARAEELAQADRTKNEFLAMLAHELRNPLAPLRNAVEMLQTAGVSDDERGQAQGILSRQIENMSRMIDDLLDVSRITQGKIELRKKPVSLEAILTTVVGLMRPECAAQGQELVVSLPAGPVFLDADATRLEQVFGNLLSNACKYSGKGCRITLGAERDGGEVVVNLRDNGIGIEPEVLPHIFELFVQANRTLDRAHGGLGIGLTLVERLVKLHGGSIEARSGGLGQGAEFIVRLPILREAPPAPPAKRVPHGPSKTPRRILIVDDHADSARSMAALQSRHGHKVRTAFSGPEALAVAAEFLPEVVLLDIGLPGMDGFEVVRQLRAMPALAGVFLVALSGYGSDADRAAAKQAGFDEHMVKPADFSLLREWLRSRV